MLRKIPYFLVALILMNTYCAQAAPRISETDIHKTCGKSPKQCLKEIDLFLNNETPESRKWFELLLYKFDALAQLVEFDTLHEEVEVWIEREDVPLRFRINVLIHYAKTLSGLGLREQSVIYMEKAVNTIAEVNNFSYDPMLLVQIANGLNYLGEYQRGYDLLKPLIAKYAARHMPKFKHELYENIGHFAYRLGNLDEHLSYRVQALEWAKAMNSDTQVAISLYNVARAYQMLGNYERAFYYFAKAETHGALGNYDTNLINFRRAQMMLAQGDTAKAQDYFANVNRDTEFENLIILFRQFEQELALAKEKSLQD